MVSTTGESKFLKTTKFCFLGLKLLLGGPGVTTHDATNSGSQTRETRALLGQRGEKPQQNFLKPHWCWLILQVCSDRVIVILKPLHVWNSSSLYESHLQILRQSAVPNELWVVFWESRNGRLDLKPLWLVVPPSRAEDTSLASINCSSCCALLSVRITSRVVEILQWGWLETRIWFTWRILYSVRNSVTVPCSSSSSFIHARGWKKRDNFWVGFLSFFLTLSSYPTWLKLVAFWRRIKLRPEVFPTSADIGSSFLTLLLFLRETVACVNRCVESSCGCRWTWALW